MSGKKSVKVEAPRKNWLPMVLFGLVLVGMIVFFSLSRPSNTSLPKATGASDLVADNSQLSNEVSVAEAVDMQKAGAFILDVREPDEWAAGHIDGATLIPLGELGARVSELPTDQEIVVVCRSGRRSAEGRDILRQAGLNSVTSMSGGMNAWVAAGNPVTTGE